MVLYPGLHSALTRRYRICRPSSVEIDTADFPLFIFFSKCLVLLATPFLLKYEPQILLVHNFTNFIPA
ncbi:MAG TPA: hypothetical protein DDW76_24270 [Cyanobacteria bacterium UBA11369]|nr:hypothetical protein [Cyanobacteria bacterium UBA11371]HBE34880.1 hypothetical protein [Cyanobacteria bacterium UBA11368]HBE51803.1 hypothetical protein [Cyanobacteria bacterium UBA11369]